MKTGHFLGGGVIKRDHYIKSTCDIVTRDSAVGSCARLVIQAQVWLQVRISVEEGLSPGVNVRANSISPRASPSDETIIQGPRHRPV